MRRGERVRAGARVQDTAVAAPGSEIYDFRWHFWDGTRCPRFALISRCSCGGLQPPVVGVETGAVAAAAFRSQNRLQGRTAPRREVG